MDRFTYFSRTAMAAAAAFVVAVPAITQNTTAGIAGRVTGADGKAVAGATVAIRHNESGSINSATTDADGRYAARGLRVGGPYTVTISKGGQTETRDGVFLALAETLAFDATLGQPTATIVVTGQGGTSKFNSASMGSGTNINNAQLNALASIQRNLQDYARTDPRISQTDKERGEISAGGQNSRYNSITIDGVRLVVDAGLERRASFDSRRGIGTLVQDLIEDLQPLIGQADLVGVRVDEQPRHTARTMDRRLRAVLKSDVASRLGNRPKQGFELVPQ